MVLPAQTREVRIDQRPARRRARSPSTRTRARARVIGSRRRSKRSTTRPRWSPLLADWRTAAAARRRRRRRGSWSAARSRPVERMRRRSTRSATRALDRRVPQPRGRDEIAPARDHDEPDARPARARPEAATTVRLGRVARAALACGLIREQAEVARAHPDGTDHSRARRHVLAEDLPVQRLVEHLLLLTRADEQTLRLGRRRRPRRSGVRRSPPTAQNNGLRIDTRGSAAARVVGDESALGQVVANLADNAARHARARWVVLAKEEGPAACSHRGRRQGHP